MKELVIYKYPLEIRDYQLVQMPVDAKILTVQLIRGVPCLYARVDKNAKEFDEKEIFVFATGQTMAVPHTKLYIGTVVIPGMIDLVYHVYTKI